jgi:hypothetical protein
MNVSALRAAGLTDQDIVRVIEKVEADRRERHRITTRQNRIAKQKQRPCARHTSTSATQEEMFEVVEDAQTRLWRVGKTILMSWGIREDRSGQMIGRWLKKRDDPEGLLATIEYARNRNVVDPIGYISSLVSSGGARGKPDVLTATGEMAAELRARECEAGLR